MFSSSQRLLAALIFGAALLWIFLSRVPTAGNASLAIPAPQKGFPAPDFSLETIDGETITLSALRGKVLVLNFWASWCPPCRAEMPTLQAVSEQYGSEMIVLGINASPQDQLANAYQLITEMKLTFPILLDSEGKALSAYRVFSLPTTFFIDQEGIIREVVIGGPLSEAGLHARLDALLRGTE